MAHYIDAFVLPLPREALDDYRQLVAAVGEIWVQHGALVYREFIGDELQHPGTGSFPEFASAGPDEVLIFGWVEFADRSARDLANERVAIDPRVGELMRDLGAGFDAQRMAYGGFLPLVSVSQSEDR